MAILSINKKVSSRKKECSSCGDDVPKGMEFIHMELRYRNGDEFNEVNKRGDVHDIHRVCSRCMEEVDNITDVIWGICAGISLDIMENSDARKD